MGGGGRAVGLAPSEDLGAEDLRRGWWSTVATWAVLLALATAGGGWASFLAAVAGFATGRLPARVDDVRMVLAVAAAAVVVALPCGLALGALVLRVVGRAWTPCPPVRSWEPGRGFPVIVLVVVVEECAARWLFLGLLPALPGLRGAVACYALALVGNLGFAGLHRWNTALPADRTWWRVLPQFGVGVVLVVVYLHAGLLAAVLAHAGYDMLLLCRDRFSRFGGGHAAVAALAAGIGTVAWAVARRPLAEAARWLDGGYASALPGWTLRDYAAAVFLALGGLTAAGGLLGYDVGGAPWRPAGVVGAAVRTLAASVVFAAVRTVDPGPAACVAVTALVLAASSATTCSGSGTARVFWLRAPVYALVVCALQALPFWSGVLLVALVELAYVAEDALGSVDLPD